MPATKRIAVWMSEKKLQKINWQELVTACSKRGFEVFKLDLNKGLKEQGPFCVLLHKLTDIIALANQGDIRSLKTIQAIERHALAQTPPIAVLDPIAHVQRLLDRYTSYSLIHASDLHNFNVFTPAFCVLRPQDRATLHTKLAHSRVDYPFICKPILGHGSRQAHEMSIVFGDQSLGDCNTPCVAQTFVNHDAVLYKIFVVGERHCYVERPSLKNFQAGRRATIRFESSDVSKADSRSRLSVLDPEDEGAREKRRPDSGVFEVIANTLRRSFGMDLLGIDVVMENSSGRYAIIDVNAYPGYDGFPNFFDALLDCISKKVAAD